jgi:peptidoglycan hydrolase CwlO-like protein
LNQNKAGEFREEGDRKVFESKKKGGGLSPAHRFLAFMLWLGVVCGGFFLAKYYFDQAIQTVQQTNAMNVQTLEARLESLAADVGEIKKDLNSAGRTLSSSDSIQKELNKKIEELDSQLKELEKSLNILREAP